MSPKNFILGLILILLVGLFSGTVKTVNVGASYDLDNFFSSSNIDLGISSKNSGTIWSANNAAIYNLNNQIKKKKDVKKEEKLKQIDLEIVRTKEIVKEDNLDQNFIQKELIIDKEIITEKEETIKIAKAKEVEKIDQLIEEKKEDNSVLNAEALIKDKKKDEETIELAADSNIALATGASDKNITYMQILLKPNDLDLNLKYARQQGDLGNYKQTIATLERMAMLYPDNVDIKLYLLSVLVKADAPQKSLTLIEEIKNISDLSAEDLASVTDIETEIKDAGEPKVWNFYADISLGGTHAENVNAISKTHTKMSSDSLAVFTTAQFDRTWSESLGLTAVRSIGEASSLIFNVSGTASQQDVEDSDNYESLGVMLAFDTSVGKHIISPYLMKSITDYKFDAISTSVLWGFGNMYTINDAHSINYGYSYSDSKGNQTSSYGTADATNAFGHSYSLGYDFMLSEIVSTSLSMGYGTSNAKDDTNDYENYDLGFRLNLGFPFAYISIGDSLSLNNYRYLDSSVSSNNLRSDLTNTFDIIATKAIGDFFPKIDPNRNLFVNFSYEKLISESNILNYDYIADTFAIGFTKSLHLNK